MSVHIHDLQEFSNGNWVISITKKRASSIAFDQALEQNHRRIQAAGGLKGLTALYGTIKPKWKLMVATSGYHNLQGI